MANIAPYIRQIQDAVYGEEVRSSIINALNLVNDDNESYQALKNEVIAAKEDVDEQVDAFDAKVEAAKAATTALETATSTANTAKSQLTSATTTANTAKTNLTTATTNANTAKTNVETATKNANTAITNAGTAKTNLEKAITNAGTAQSDLQAVIDAAGVIKTQLGDLNTTAGTSKTNLETAINNANTAKNQLQGVIDAADTAKSELSDVIITANTARQNLEGATSTANGVLQNLQAENASAKSNIAKLQDENFNSQEILSGVADLRAYLGLYDSDVIGVQVDYKNKTYTRLAAATGLNFGTDFDQFEMFGGRKRCNLANDGTILAWQGEDGYKEDGSNGQVMVYQPAFWYLVAPVEYERQATGVGYHLRKANYYVSGKQRAGFRLHPAFYDANGNEVDHIFYSAFRGSIFDTSENAYLMNDEQVMDVNTDLFCSIAGVKPASGVTQQLTRPNLERMAANRGSGWHGDLIKPVSANQLLMLIECAGNLQSVIGQGVVSISDSPNTTNNSSLTGSTSSLGNASGRAAKTINERNGTTYEETANGKTSITYRGMEDPWGNIWDFVYGVNIWGNGNINGGQPYICNDFNFAESKNSGNYEPAGFTVTDANGYISAMGYSTDHDWLFFASETKGDSSLPIGDYHYVTANLNGYRLARLGGYWNSGAYAGGFSWYLNSSVGDRTRTVGGRLVYIPTNGVDADAA